MSSAASSSSLPSGLAVLTTFPDVLFIPEFIAVPQPAVGYYWKPFHFYWSAEQQYHKTNGNICTWPSLMSVVFMRATSVLLVQIFGGLVWILVASSRVPAPILQGWVMFVSVFCFVMSTALLFLYMCGAHGGSSSWVTLDVICQETAALFYLSAAVLEAYVTYAAASLPVQQSEIYRENIAAVVFAFLATLVYVIHKAGSLLRWKSS